eukprot:1322355-Amphidinium_carterae.1
MGYATLPEGELVDSVGKSYSLPATCDINASVVPLSTGTSPTRVPPHESLLKAEKTANKAPEAALGLDDAGQKSKPKLDVPFCLDKLKPIWLPIKAHRFAAYRAK